MHVIEYGRLAHARQSHSPNFDQRPADADIDLLVIHNISLPPGKFGGNWIDDLFLNRLDARAHPYFASIANIRVSSHLLVRRSGELVQYVPLHYRAWHAGISEFRGRARCNDFSIGIELEGTDDLPFEDAQYETLVDAACQIILAYPAITRDRIVGHSDIAPDRKTDPGPAFDWQVFRLRLQDALEATRNQ